MQVQVQVGAVVPVEQAVVQVGQAVVQVCQAVVHGWQAVVNVCHVVQSGYHNAIVLRGQIGFRGQLGSEGDVSLCNALGKGMLTRWNLAVAAASFGFLSG